MHIIKPWFPCGLWDVPGKLVQALLFSHKIDMETRFASQSLAQAGMGIGPNSFYLRVTVPFSPIYSTTCTECADASASLSGQESDGSIESCQTTYKTETCNICYIVNLFKQV